MSCKCAWSPECDGNGNLFCQGCAGNGGYCGCTCGGEEYCDGCAQCARAEDDVPPWDTGRDEEAA